MRTATVRKSRKPRKWDLSDVQENLNRYACRVVGQPDEDRYSRTVHDRVRHCLAVGFQTRVSLEELRDILSLRDSLIDNHATGCEVRTPNRGEDARLSADWMLVPIVHRPRDFGLELVEVQ